MASQVDSNNILSLNLKLLMIAGIWCRDTIKHRRTRIFYSFYEKAVFLIITSYNCGVFLHPFLVKQSMEDFVDSLVIFICEILHYGKYVSILLQKKKLTKLTVFLENNLHIQGNVISDMEKEVKQRKVALARKITIFYFSSLCITATAMVVPVVAVVLFEYLNKNAITHELVIWKMWIPFDYSQFPTNVIVFVYQIIATFYTGCSIIGTVNAFFMSVIVCTSLLFEMLSTSIKNAEKSPDIQLHIRNCIIYHQNILKYVWAIYIFNRLYVGFIYDDVLFQSEEVGNAAYESDWYNMPINTKNSIRMVIMRCQRRVAIATGPFGYLSMPLFA
ncbi:hypothetical protein L9F63_004953, partial [Diploptera punctata]